MLTQEKTKKFVQGHKMSMQLSFVACKGCFHCLKDCARLSDVIVSSKASHANREGAKSFIKLERHSHWKGRL